MFKNILNGLRAYGGTFKLISQLGLWKYFGIPILISVLTAVGIGFAAYGFSDNLGSLISKAWIWDWGSETFRTISDILGGIMIVTLGLILYKHIVMALSAPFMSPVSEKIEAHLTGVQHEHRKTSFRAQLWRGIKVNGRNLLMEIFLSIPIFIIGFIPIIGVISTVLLFLVQSYYAGFGNMDYTLERHFGYSKSVRFVSDHRGLAIGNGMVFILMLFVPVLGIIFVLPLSVTAATTETIKILYPQEK
jgi:CysZ protein